MVCKAEDVCDASFVAVGFYLVVVFCLAGFLGGSNSCSYCSA